jgi:protein dithiol:quinone oxidoreductase
VPTFHPQAHRYCYLLIAIGCSLLIAIALYMQYQMDLIPCALCMTQRVFIIAIGVIALIAWLHQANTLGARIYPIIGMLFATIGAGFASRHIWLQSLPEDLAPACGPSLSYLLETVPFLEALSVLLQGDGNCAKSVWSFLGLTIPGWTLVAFIGLFSVNGFILWLACRNTSGK